MKRIQFKFDEGNSYTSGRGDYVGYVQPVSISIGDKIWEINHNEILSNWGNNNPDWFDVYPESFLEKINSENNEFFSAEIN